MRVPGCRASLAKWRVVGRHGMRAVVEGQSNPFPARPAQMRRRPPSCQNVTGSVRTKEADLSHK